MPHRTGSVDRLEIMSTVGSIPRELSARRTLARSRVAGLVLVAATTVSHAAQTTSEGFQSDEPAIPENVRCDDTGVVVQHASPEELDDVCRGALDALEFLSGLGLATDLDLVVKLLPGMPSDTDGSRSAGNYIGTDQRVLVLDHEGFFALDTFLGQPVDQALYRAVVAHEIAHAVMAWNFLPETPSRLAHEYVAAVVTLATMDVEHRDRLLVDLQNPAYSDGSEISLMYYLMAPARFMVKVYRHFQSPDAGADFIARIIAGDALNRTIHMDDGGVNARPVQALRCVVPQP